MSQAPAHVRKEVGLRLKALVLAVAETENKSAKQVLEAVERPQNRWGNWYNGDKMADPYDCAVFVNRFGGSLDWIYRNEIRSIPDQGLRDLTARHHRQLLNESNRLHVA